MGPLYLKIVNCLCRREGDGEREGREVMRGQGSRGDKGRDREKERTHIHTHTPLI